MAAERKNDQDSEYVDNNDATQKITNQEDLLMDYPTKQFPFRDENDKNNRITICKIKGLPDKCYAFELRNVLSPKECEVFIKNAEEMGFTEAPLNIVTNGFDAVKNKKTQTIRNSLRVLCQMPHNLNVAFSNRILPFIPNKININGETWNILKDECINPRWRFNKYAQNMYFKPHVDTGYAWSWHKRCSMTIIIYLNEGFVGGETIFYPEGFTYKSNPKKLVIKPEIGKALIFVQRGHYNPVHEGAQHHSKGKYKYIIRSDLVFVTSDDE